MADKDGVMTEAQWPKVKYDHRLRPYLQVALLNPLPRPWVPKAMGQQVDACFEVREYLPTGHFVKGRGFEYTPDGDVPR